MDNSKSLSILLFTLILIFSLPGGIAGAGNVTNMTDTVNVSPGIDTTLYVSDNLTRDSSPANVSGMVNESEDNPPPPDQNGTPGSGEDAVQKAFTGWYNQGMKALSAGNFQSASEAFAAALRLDKDSENASVGYARSLSELGRNNESLSIYLIIQNRSPENRDILLPLSRELNTAGRYDEAGVILRNITKLAPEDPVGWNQLATSYAGKSRFEEALSAVRTSLSLSLNQSEGWGCLGAVLAGQGRFYEAVASFEKSITLDPKNAEAWSGLGNTWTALNQYNEAASSYQAVTDIRPDKKDAWLNLAQVYEKQGKFKEASDIQTRWSSDNLTTTRQ